MKVYPLLYLSAAEKICALKGANFKAKGVANKAGEVPGGTPVVVLKLYPHGQNFAPHVQSKPQTATYASVKDVVIQQVQKTSKMETTFQS